MIAPYRPLCPPAARLIARTLRTLTRQRQYVGPDSTSAMGRYQAEAISPPGIDPGVNNGHARGATFDHRLTMSRQHRRSRSVLGEAPKRITMGPRNLHQY